VPHLSPGWIRFAPIRGCSSCNASPVCPDERLAPLIARAAASDSTIGTENPRVGGSIPPLATNSKDQAFHFVQPGLGGPCRECQPCLNDAAAGRGDGQL